MKIKPTEEVTLDKCEEFDEDPEEDPDEDPEEDSEEEYEEEEVSEEELESDSKEELEKESNFKPNEETGFADHVLEDKITSSKTTDESAVNGQRCRTSLDLLQEEEREKGEEEKPVKVRKRRWGSDVSQSKSKENNVDSNSDPKHRWLKQKLVVLNEEILKVEACKRNPGKEKKRRKQIEFLVTKRHKLLSELISLEDSKLKVPKGCDQRKDKIFKKVYIPVKKYPSYNFVGPILDTKKKMEVESGASIKLRGKGSLNEDTKPEDDGEDLHVHTEADTEKSLEAAVTMVEKLLVPLDDRDNKLKIIRGTNSNVCALCNDPGHKIYACPNHKSNFEKVTACTKCGSFSHLVSQCPLNSKPNPTKVINEANLYVGYLPQTADENWLKERFCPFGNIISARVINDHFTGLSKGYGFVNFQSPLDAAMAVKHMNGHQVEGRAIAVRVAGLPPQPNVSVLNPFPTGFVGPRVGPPGFMGPRVGLPAFTGPWVGPTGLIPPQQLPHQPGLPAPSPFPPCLRPAAISPNISTQMGSWSNPSSPSQNMSQFEPNSVYAKQGLSSSRGSSRFPGDPNYRSSSSLFPGDPDYCGSSSLF